MKKENKNNENIIIAMFYSTVFIAFGLGALIESIVHFNNGGWIFIATGFILALIGIYFR